MTKLSDYQKILFQQLSEMKPLWRHTWKVQTIVIDGEYKVKLCCRFNPVKVNIIIEYNVGTDYYDLEAWPVRGVDFWKCYEVTDVGWETLVEQIEAAIKEANKQWATKVLEDIVDDFVSG